ncbi:MAG: glycoside hydrolase family 5 protein [Spirochaetaceae bacterium]|nr:glycoside hydrolase family 5 protein [Spirochaetaceae bacterium]
MPFTKGFDMLKWFEPLPGSLPDLNKYDEADFVCLKSMGVDIIRLPVHFELLMEPKNIGKVNDIIFEKLDQVCDWAEKYQIYLVIDNHSFNEMEIQNKVTLETYKTHLQALWPQIAERYKNRSEYIIYEILNEPPDNLSNSWYKIQKETIDLIRQYDSKRTIVVTCANWSNPDNLVKMKPYEDQNLIYTFHFYDPGPFTTQGTEWGGGGDTIDLKGLPFPYDKSRVPKLNNNFKEWVRSYIKNEYPKEGTVKYINDRIKKVASWAKKNNVRIWAGEMGAAVWINPTDRFAWINATVAAFKENNIPYCVWGLDDDTGILKTADATMVFPDDINTEALEAYGFTMPDESIVAKTNQVLRDFPQKPYLIYDGITGKGNSRYYLYGDINNATDDSEHGYCIKMSWPSENSGCRIPQLPALLTSKIAENNKSLSISLSVKFTNTNQEFKFYLVDSDGGEAQLPWRKVFVVKASDYKVGEWTTVEIPVSQFSDSRGAWTDKDGGKWFDLPCQFDWSRFEGLWLEFSDYSGKINGDVYIDDIVIKKK